MMGWTTGIVALVLLGFGWWGFAGQVNAQRSPAPAGAQEFPVSLDGVLPAEAQEDHLFECWLGDAIVLARSPELGSESLPRFAGGTGTPTFSDVVLYDGREARAVAVRYLPPEPRPQDSTRPKLFGASGGPASPIQAHPVEVVVAQDTESLDAILRHLRWLLVASWLVTTLLSAGALAWIVRRGLAPLKDLGEQIHGKDEAQLGTPFSLPGASDELVPVVDRLNGFMHRIDGAIRREHDFAAHAAHELRTPLAGLRSTLEVSLSREREPADYQESERASLSIAVQLERLVERLLELARTAAPQAEVRAEDFRLADLIREAWAPFSDAAAERGVLLEFQLQEDIFVFSDRQLLGRVLSNLLENAGNYAQADTEARISIGRLDGEVWLTVENHCSNLDPELLERAFDAFWRSDSARTATGRHAGLGLALCRQIMELLRGTIRVSGNDDLFRVTVTLPAGGSSLAH